MRILAIAVPTAVAAVLLGLHAANGPGWLMAQAAQPSVVSQSPGQVRPPFTPVSSWGKKLNPSGMVPDRGFKVFYFDRNSQAAMFEHHVGSVAIKYAWDELHGIDSGAFAAYWVGRLSFDTSGPRQIAISQSWAKARIFVDGRLIYDGGGSEVITHDFSAGDHLLEVEYINNWHTVEFKVTVDETARRHSREEIGHLLATGEFGTSYVYYVGLYESGRGDASVDVRLPRTDRPVIVWLDSYEAIDWNISPSDGIAAAVIASSSPGARIESGAPGKVYHAERGFGVRSREISGCHCTAGHYHCENNGDLGQVERELQRMGGLRLAGAAVHYSAADLEIEPWSAAAAAEVRLRRAATERARNQCSDNADPDFDTLLR